MKFSFVLIQTTTVMMKATLFGCIAFALVLYFDATDAVTFQPFVRSRYSIRKRLTTAMAPTVSPDVKSNESSSSVPQPMATTVPEHFESTSATSWSFNAIDFSSKEKVAPEKPHTELPLKHSTTEYVRGKSSTPSGDYDYYGNGENEDADLNDNL